MSGFEDIANACDAHDVGKFVRIKHDSSYAERCDDACKLGKYHHCAFDVHVAVDESRGKPTPLQVAFFEPLITFTCTPMRDAADYATIGDGYIGGITFAATYVY